MKIFKNETFIQIVTCIVMFIILTLLVWGVNTVERKHCEKTGGEFILRYGDRNACIEGGNK